MTVEIVGREKELRSIQAFFKRTNERPAALVLEGGAGIGKSTLWLAAVNEAREGGFSVLISRPAEAERGLAFAALGDLLEDVLDEIVPLLSSPRRRALEAALLLAEANESLDPRALGVAVRNGLEILAADELLVVAVDDVQWLDRSSESALSFALRRMDEPVVLLLTRRLAEGIEPSEIEQALAPDSVQRLSVGPLSVGAIQRLLQDRLDRIFPRPMLLRIHEASGGNPLYALELARALGADVDPTQPLSVPETLEGLVRSRLDGLPDATRQVLMLASALGHPSVALMRAAGVRQEALGPAFDAHVIEHADGTIHFTHPLLASVVYLGFSANERRRAHGRLAEIVDDPLERARHLALASEDPDDAIAAAVEDAAVLAISRGAPITAAELGEHALRLTPPGAHADLHRRGIELARAHLAAANVPRARALAHLLTQRPHGPRRAEALVLFSEIEVEARAQIELLEEALCEAADDLRLQALIHQRLGWAAGSTEGPRVAEGHAQAVLDLGEQLGDDGLRAAALGTFAGARFIAGKRGAQRLAAEAYALAAAAADPRQRLSAGMSLASTLVWSARLDQARALLEAFYEEWNERDETAVWPILYRLGRVELFAGRFSLAAEHADRAREIDLLFALDEKDGPVSLWLVASIAAHRGDLAGARAIAEQGRALAEEIPLFRGSCEGVLGLVDLWTADARSAVEHFAAAEEAYRTLEIGEPAFYWWRRDYAEGLLELDLVDRAVELLDAWEADARRLGREWVLAQATCCRGLVAAANRDVEQALSRLEQAVAKHEAVGDPFGRARTLLALGIVRRRARQKRPAREAIEVALEGFEAMGAAGWAEKARAELGRIGGRAREKGLTPAESRVAALVAEGRTNREVAAALFLGERTVETHLTRIYAKLGVRSRTELASRLR
jgi:DNA-binding CsgD family transcriptional regulator